MYAVVQTGGKQYRVAVGDVLRVEKLEAAEGKQDLNTVTDSVCKLVEQPPPRWLDVQASRPQPASSRMLLLKRLPCPFRTAW